MIRRFGFYYASIDEIVRRYNYTPETILMLAKTGKVGSVRYEDKPYIRLADIHAYAQSQVEERVKKQLAMRGSKD